MGYTAPAAVWQKRPIPILQRNPDVATDRLHRPVVAAAGRRHCVPVDRARARSRPRRSRSTSPQGGNAQLRACCSASAGAALLAIPAIAQQAQPPAAAAAGRRADRQQQSRPRQPSRRRRASASSGPARERGRGRLRPRRCRRRRRRSNIRRGRGATRGRSAPSIPPTAALAPAPWGEASGAFLSTLMRRMDTPIASRWAQIALRNALLARTRAAARRQSGRLGRRARLAAAAAGRGRCSADAGRRGRYRPLHAQDDPGRGAEPRSPPPTRRHCARSRTRCAATSRGVRPTGHGHVRVACRRARKRLGPDRQCPALRPDRRDRPGAGRKGGRRGLQYRPLGDDRVGAGRAA